MSAKNDHGLTAAQERFAQEVVKGLSMTEAMYIAYPASKRWKTSAVHNRASKLAHLDLVRKRIDLLTIEAASQAVLEAADVMLEVKRLALSDIAGVMHEDGRVKLPNELDPATRAAISSFKIDEYGRIEYKFWDKNSALDKAMKHLGLFERDNGQKTNPLLDLLAGLSGNVLGPAQVLPTIDDEDD